MNQDDSSPASTLPKNLQALLLPGQSGHSEHDNANLQHPYQARYHSPLEQQHFSESTYIQPRHIHPSESFSFSPPYLRSSNYRPQSWHGNDPIPSSRSYPPFLPTHQHSIPHQPTSIQSYGEQFGLEPISPNDYAEQDWEDESDIGSYTGHSSNGSYESSGRHRDLRQSHLSFPRGYSYQDSDTHGVHSRSASFQSPNLSAVDTQSGQKDSKRRTKLVDQRFKSSGSPTPSKQGKKHKVLEKAKAQSPKRQKTAIACDFCRKRKLGCDGKRPRCGKCEKLNLNCEYAPKVKRRGPGKASKESRKKTREPSIKQEEAAIAYSHREHFKDEDPCVKVEELNMRRYPSQTEFASQSTLVPLHETFSGYDPAIEKHFYRPQSAEASSYEDLKYPYEPSSSGFKSTNSQHGFTDAPHQMGLESSSLAYPSQRSSSQYAYSHNFPGESESALPTPIRYQAQPYSDGGGRWRNEMAPSSSSEMTPFGRSSTIRSLLPFQAQYESHFPRHLTSAEREARFIGVEEPSEIVIPPHFNEPFDFGPFSPMTETPRLVRALKFEEDSAAETRPGPYNEQYSLASSSQQFGLGSNQTNTRTHQTQMTDLPSHQLKEYQARRRYPS